MVMTVILFRLTLTSTTPSTSELCVCNGIDSYLCRSSCNNMWMWTISCATTVEAKPINYLLVLTWSFTQQLAELVFKALCDVLTSCKEKKTIKNDIDGLIAVQLIIGSSRPFENGIFLASAHGPQILFAHGLSSIVCPQVTPLAFLCFVPRLASMAMHALTIYDK